MVDVVRRRGGRGRGWAAERLAPLGDVAAQYASMGWPVCMGAHPLPGQARRDGTGPRLLVRPGGVPGAGRAPRVRRLANAGDRR